MKQINQLIFPQVIDSPILSLLEYRHRNIQCKTKRKNMIDLYLCVFVSVRLICVPVSVCPADLSVHKQ